ncbi:MAG: signal recognition particle-docking protein FtsY [Thermodesulfobacteriota bacterium]
MEDYITLLNNLYTNYQDIIWIVLSLLGILLISLLVTYLFKRKPVNAQKELSPENVSTDDVTPFQSSVQPSAEILLEREPEHRTFEPQNIAEGLIQHKVEYKVPKKTIEMTRDQEIVEEEIRVKPVEPPLEPQESKERLFSRLRSGLSMTQVGLLGKLDSILSRKEVDSDLWDDFEEALITADIGVGTTMKLRQEIEGKMTKKSLRDPRVIREALKEESLNILKKAEGSQINIDAKPFVVIIAGVNGVGKTTTIGKISYKLNKEGRKVMIAAADTFRAAAVEQLEIWAKRVGTDFIKGKAGADPSAVVFDAIKASLARGTDVLIIDTAGRLHTKTNLMEELKKIRRVIGRELNGAPHETLLVLDATTGQNAIQQAKIFKEAIDITGIILTKLDGTAKGGVIMAIADELNTPVKFIGIGESLEDLREFNAEEFVEALFLTGKETLH